MAYDRLEQDIFSLGRGVEEVITQDDLIFKLVQAQTNKKPLIVKEGVDPTAQDLHLGHTVTFRKLKHFQDLGHEVKFLIGDFTARIGDPTGRSNSRKALTEEEVLENAKTYEKQIFKILDPDKTEIVWNSSWLKPFSLEQFIDLMYRGTVNDFIKRKSMATRLEEGDTVTATELIYPFLQAYDSVFLNSDIEIGGMDQKFNFVFTRDLQRSFGQEPQACLIMPLLTGTDGTEKMSKSLGNHVGISDSPDEMYGKIMSIPDKIMYNWFELLTDIPIDELVSMESARLRGELHPKDMKVRLAKEIVSQYHSLDEALDSQKEFEKIYARGEIPTTIPEVIVSNEFLFTEGVNIVDILMSAGYAKSRGDARRKITQGGVRVDGETISDVEFYIPAKDGQILNVGKRNFATLKYEPG